VKAKLIILAAMVPVLFVGVGLGVLFGWPWGLVAGGALLWIEDVAIMPLSARRVKS
jgi:hypothetical protein